MITVQAHVCRYAREAVARRSHGDKCKQRCYTEVAERRRLEGVPAEMPPVRMDRLSGHRADVRHVPCATLPEPRVAREDMPELWVAWSSEVPAGVPTVHECGYTYTARGRHATEVVDLMQKGMHRHMMHPECFEVDG